MTNFTETIKNEIVKAIKYGTTFDGETIDIENVLSMHINKEKNCIDFYRYASREEMEQDDYDFDKDYILTVYLED